MSAKPSPAPLVSVITPCLNMAGYLGQAIDSVLNQNYGYIEYIVMDGGSTDGTIDLLKSYGDRLRFVSEPDKGPADAIERGFSKASGEIFCWLNADDALLPGAIRFAAEYFAAHPGVDIFFGEGYWIDEAGQRIERYPTLPSAAKELERDCFICQPAAFFRASAYRRCRLEPAQQWSFDYDLWIRMSKLGLTFAHAAEDLAYSRMHRSAKTLKERKQVLISSMELLNRHYGYIPLHWVLTYTAFRMDGRDQFFEPFKPSALKFIASLPMGIWYNRRRPFKYVSEWTAVAAKGLATRIKSLAAG